MGQSGLGEKEQGGCPCKLQMCSTWVGEPGKKDKDHLESHLHWARMQRVGWEGFLSTALVLKFPQKMPESVS